MLRERLPNFRPPSSSKSATHVLAEKTLRSVNACPFGGLNGYESGTAICIMAQRFVNCEGCHHERRPGVYGLLILSSLMEN